MDLKMIVDVKKVCEFLKYNRGIWIHIRYKKILFITFN